VTGRRGSPLGRWKRRRGALICVGCDDGSLQTRGLEPIPACAGCKPSRNRPASSLVYSVQHDSGQHVFQNLGTSCCVVTLLIPIATAVPVHSSALSMVLCLELLSTMPVLCFLHRQELLLCLASAYRTSS
jgi:hypothetical protein